MVRKPSSAQEVASPTLKQIAATHLQNTLAHLSIKVDLMNPPPPATPSASIICLVNGEERVVRGEQANFLHSAAHFEDDDWLSTWVLNEWHDGAAGCQWLAVRGKLKDAGVTNEEIAKICNVDKSRVSQWFSESGAASIKYKHVVAINTGFCEQLKSLPAVSHRERATAGGISAVNSYAGMFQKILNKGKSTITPSEFEAIRYIYANNLLQCLHNDAALEDRNSAWRATNLHLASVKLAPQYEWSVDGLGEILTRWGYCYETVVSLLPDLLSKQSAMPETKS